MRKAHLFEALYLVNQSTDEAVRGLDRLRKAPGLAEDIYGDTLATLQRARALVNLQFFADMRANEQHDAAHYQRPENKSGKKDSEP